MKGKSYGSSSKGGYSAAKGRGKSAVGKVSSTGHKKGSNKDRP